VFDNNPDTGNESVFTLKDSKITENGRTPISLRFVALWFKNKKRLSLVAQAWNFWN